MIFVTGTSIIVATSLTVTNSVTFKILLSAAAASNSASDCWRWASLFSLLYLAPFPLLDFPWSFSRVSLTCFWISASVSSSFGATVLLWGPLLLLFPPLFCPPLFWPWPLFWLFWFPPEPGLLILFLFLLAASLLFWVLDLSSGFFFAFSNCLRSIFLPVNLGPSNFLYCVLIV